MAYVPPSLRTQEDKDSEALRIIAEGKDTHFPLLSGSAPVSTKNSIYAEKAKEWEANRKALELKESVEAEVSRIMEERRVQQDREIHEIIRHTKRTKELVVKEEPIPILEKKSEDEWTLVQKKVRKPKQKVHIETEEEFINNLEDLAEDQVYDE
jgi:hypothetical protein